MKSIKERWDEFEGYIMPSCASEIQRNEMKKAFYAGATSMFFLTGDIAEECETDDEGAMALDKVYNELNEFKEGMNG